MLQGTITALITPFGEDGGIDEAALRKMVDFQIENGINGLVPCGTTGESPTLDYDEHNRVIDIVIDQARGLAPVIAGTGSNSTKEAISLTRHAADAGAGYSLQVAPYYNKPTQRGFYEHFAAIADSIALPIIIYNIPGRTGKNIEAETILKLAEHQNIVGVKEASGNLSQIMTILNHRPAGFTVLSGDDNLTFPLMALGGDGVISVASNIVPERVCGMVNLALEGRWEESRQRHYDLLPLFNALFLETNPIPIKAALHLKGIVKEAYRLPLCGMEPANRAKLEKVLEDLKIV
ncbi:MAG: 4-hydroxy-tetrahydrodipicolinate synthase [Deltaproteobacteria bacterium]|nr:4-hydroxy-tetrahydrodipicolinate synthase [Deltaproteobacteria bacterium]